MLPGLPPGTLPVLISVVEGVWGMHWGEVLSLMLHQCVVDCIVVVCQSSVRDLFFNRQALG